MYAVFKKKGNNIKIYIFTNKRCILVVGGLLYVCHERCFIAEIKILKTDALCNFIIIYFAYM
jgi:hypothetical protein